MPGITEFAADEIYFGPQIELDRQVRTFLAAAQSFLDLPASRRQHEHVFLDYMLGERGEVLHADQARAAASLVTSADQDTLALRRVLWVMFAALMLSIFVEWLLIYRPSFRRMLERNLALQSRAESDPLTGVANRSRFMAAAQDAVERSQGAKTPVAVIMIDLDHFKHLNDTYGHHVGDAALIAVASTIGDQLRKGDRLARLGGEEFAVLLPGTNHDAAVEIAERLRLAVHSTVIPCDGQDPPRGTSKNCPGPAAAVSWWSVAQLGV